MDTRPPLSASPPSTQAVGAGARRVVVPPASAVPSSEETYGWIGYEAAHPGPGFSVPDVPDAPDACTTG